MLKKTLLYTMKETRGDASFSLSTDLVGFSFALLASELG